MCRVLQADANQTLTPTVDVHDNKIPCDICMPRVDFLDRTIRPVGTRPTFFTSTSSYPCPLNRPRRDNPTQQTDEAHRLVPASFSCATTAAKFSPHLEALGQRYRVSYSGKFANPNQGTRFAGFMIRASLLYTPGTLTRNETPSQNFG